MDPSDPDRPKPAKAIQFLETTAIAVFPVFSPDGRYVAYFSNESGGYEVYVRPAPGPDGKPSSGKWQVSTGGGVYPAWSPNGRELFYIGLSNGLIMVADYTATLLLAQGVSPRYITELLGHSQVSFTMQVYAHVLPEVQTQVAATMDEILAPKPVATSAATKAILPKAL